MYNYLHQDKKSQPKKRRKGPLKKNHSGQFGNPGSTLDLRPTQKVYFFLA